MFFNVIYYKIQYIIEIITYLLDGDSTSRELREANQLADVALTLVIAGSHVSGSEL